MDFIKPPVSDRGEWESLQVKNRDNSENSSSRKVRDGTNIQHWHRTFAKTGKTNWENFPEQEAKGKLTEKGFQKFVESYFNTNK